MLVCLHTPIQIQTLWIACCKYVHCVSVLNKIRVDTPHCKPYHRGSQLPWALINTISNWHNYYIKCLKCNKDVCSCVEVGVVGVAVEFNCPLYHSTSATHTIYTCAHKLGSIVYDIIMIRVIVVDTMSFTSSDSRSINTKKCNQVGQTQ